MDLNIFFDEPCPLCGGSTYKVMYMGAPMRMCHDEKCACVSGWWSWVMDWVPYNGWFVRYDGGYWSALWRWLVGDLDD